MAATDILIRLAAQGAQTVSNEMRGVARETAGIGAASGVAAHGVDDLDQALDRAGANDGLRAVARDADDAGDKISGAGNRAEELSGKLEKARNVGLAMTAIGVGGLALSQSFIEAHKEGDGLEKKLESILTAQNRLGDLDAINAAIGDVTAEGHFDDDDSIRDAAIHMASFGVESAQVADLLPRVARQVRTGFGDMTSVADGMGKAYANIDVGPLSRSGLVFTDAEKAAIAYAKSLGEVEGRAKFVEVVMAAVDRNTANLGDSLTNAEAAANDLANAWDGASTTMGAGAGEAQAGVNNLLASILNTVNAAPQLEYAAGYLGYFVSGGATAVGGLLSVGSQIGLTIISMQSMGITSIAAWSSWASGAMAAGAATWAAIAPLLPLILGIIAVIALAAAAFYGLDKLMNAKEDKELAANIATGDIAGKQLLEIENKRRSKRGQKTLTMDEFQGNPDADLLKADTSAGDMGAAGFDALNAQAKSIADGSNARPMMPMPANIAAPVFIAPIQTANIGAPVGVATAGATSAPDAPATKGDVRRANTNVVGEIVATMRGAMGGATGGKGLRVGPVKNRVDQGADGRITVFFEPLQLPERGLGSVM